MAIVFNAILSVISTLTSIATIGSFIVPLVIQRIQSPGSKEREVKSRRQKILRMLSGITLITLAALMTIITLTDQSSSTTFHDKLLNTQPDSVAWSADSTQIATADISSGSIKIWDVSTGKTLMTYQPPGTQVSSLAWSPDGKYLAANVNGALYILQVDIKMLHRIFVLPGFLLSPGPDVIAWSPDGTQIAVAGAYGDVRVWNVIAGSLETGRAPLIYRHHTRPVISISWSPDGRFIASASLDNTIKLWEPGKRDVVYRTIPVGSIKGLSWNNSRRLAYLSSVTWSPDGQNIALEDSNGILSVWDLTGRKIVNDTVKQGNLKLSTGTIAWSPDSQLIVVGTVIGLAVIDGHNGNVKQWFSYDDPSFPQYALAWSPDQAYIAATSSKGVILYPSKEDDDVVYPIQSQQNRSTSWFWFLLSSPLLWLFLRDESIIMGIALGITILYNDLEKPRLDYIPRSKKQNMLLHRKYNWVYMVAPALIIWGIFFLVLFNVKNYIPAAIVTFLWGCVTGVWFISYDVIPQYLYPMFIKVFNYFNVKSYMKAGDKYEKQKKYHQAISQYDEALTLLPRYAPAYIQRGFVYLSLGEYQWALDDINQALDLKPQNGGIYEERGDAHLGLKEYKKAVEDYSKAAEVIVADADKAELYWNRGNAYLWLGNLSQARVDFLRSDALDQNSLNSAWMAVWTRLGKKRVDKETAEQFAEHLKMIADRDPQSYTARLCLGVSLALRGNVKSGLKEIEQAIVQSPQYSDAYFWKGLLLAYYYQGKSHADEVVEAIQQAIDKDLPPLLLTPLYWLEEDIPTFFASRIQPLLQQHLK